MEAPTKTEKLEYEGPTPAPPKAPGRVPLGLRMPGTAKGGAPYSDIMPLGKPPTPPKAGMTLADGNNAIPPAASGPSMFLQTVIIGGVEPLTIRCAC